MKVFSFILFIGLFIVGCGDDGDLSSEYNSSGDLLSEVGDGEVRGEAEDISLIEERIGTAQELLAQAEAQAEASSGLSDEQTEERSPALQIPAVLFSAENFQFHETHVCRKSGNPTYTYELYENRIAGPYLCYLIHRYKNCGASYSPQTESCYHSAVWQAGFCRNKLNQNIEKRVALGYECEMEEPEGQGVNGGDTAEPANDDEGAPPTAEEEEPENGDDDGS